MILFIHMDLVAALGGIPGAFFLPFLAPLPDFINLNKTELPRVTLFNDTHFKADFVFCIFAVTGN